MKKALFILFILNIGNLFSQTEEDYSEVIRLVISEYQKDTIKVYKKFHNNKLHSDLIGVKSEQDSKISKKYKILKDSVRPDINRLNTYVDQEMEERNDDSTYVEIENIKILFFSNLEMIDNKNKGRIDKYYKAEFENNRKNRPIAFISYPLISIDKNKAIVYGSYVCGGLCGSGGIYFLEKVNEKWKVSKYEIRWTS